MDSNSGCWDDETCTPSWSGPSLGCGRGAGWGEVGITNTGQVITNAKLESELAGVMLLG